MGLILAWRTTPGPPQESQRSYSLLRLISEGKWTLGSFLSSSASVRLLLTSLASVPIQILPQGKGTSHPGPSLDRPADSTQPSPSIHLFIFFAC